jgi:ANTAR domain
MTSRHSRTTDTGGAHRRPHNEAAEDRAARPGGSAEARQQARSLGPERAGDLAFAPEGAGDWPPGAEPVARRTATGWRVGDEEVSDLTSAMVLADLLAADLPTQAMPAVGTAAPGGAPAGSGVTEGARTPPGEVVDPERLQETVAQLEHALTARVRVEQAIGVLAERHRLRPRQAFELLRSAARARGKRVLEIATEVVDSATNPLQRIPEELAKPPVTRRRGRVPRHTLDSP